MSKAKILVIINPLMGLLIANQAVTGMNADRLGDRFLYAHVLPGFLLAALAIVHLILNWPWVRANYFKGKNDKK